MSSISSTNMTMTQKIECKNYCGILATITPKERWPSKSTSIISERKFNGDAFLRRGAPFDVVAHSRRSHSNGNDHPDALVR